MLMVTRSCMKSPRHIFGMNRRRLLCSLLWPVILRFANLIEAKIDEQIQWIKKSKESFDSFKYLEVESFVFSSKRICQFYHLQMLEVSPKHEELPTSYGSNPSAAGVLCTMLWCQSSKRTELGILMAGNSSPVIISWPLASSHDKKWFHCSLFRTCCYSHLLHKWISFVPSTWNQTKEMNCCLHPHLSMPWSPFVS